MFTSLTNLKIYGIDVKFIRCDDSGENKSFYDSCQANGHNIKFEFSGPSTPQQNGKVERKFRKFNGRIIVTMNNGELEDIKKLVYGLSFQEPQPYSPILPQLRQIKVSLSVNIWKQT
jgi:hypothetical protein